MVGCIAGTGIMVRSSKTLAYNTPTWRYIPENGIFLIFDLVIEDYNVIQ
jgi:hypothetical protein